MNVSERVAFVSQSLDSLPTEEFLRVVGQRVRRQRSQMNMSRKRLAEVSGVSERYLAQLESGQGNMSIALLRKVTSSIGMSLGALMTAEVTEVTSRSTPVNVSQGTAIASSSVTSDRADNKPVSSTSAINSSDEPRSESLYASASHSRHIIS
ncbi:MAG: helix-turn-helix domain-containing protein [Granulosicoccus sp.]